MEGRQRISEVFGRDYGDLMRDVMIANSVWSWSGSVWICWSIYVVAVFGVRTK